MSGNDEQTREPADWEAALERDDAPASPGESADDDGTLAARYAAQFAPLLDHWDQRSGELANSFVSPEKPSEVERQSLRRFTHLCLRYAHLEHQIEGTIPCEIPAHFAMIRDAETRLDNGLAEMVEELAATERQRLELPEGPIESLGEVLDERGIKVIEWAHPAGGHSGAFLFDSDTGPALLSLAPIGSATGRYVLAHVYCHLLADVDPYENRFCPHGMGQGALRKGGRLLDHVRGSDAHDALILPELRADLFARAFLLPAEHFANTLSAFGADARRPLDLPLMGELAFYYGVDTPVVVNRLLDLGLLSADRAVELAASLQDAPAAEERAAGRQDSHAGDGRGLTEEGKTGDATADPRLLEGLPVRFVNLSLALFLRRVASREHLCKLLDADPPEVERLLSWLDLPADLRRPSA